MCQWEDVEMCKCENAERSEVPGAKRSGMEMLSKAKSRERSDPGWKYENVRIWKCGNVEMCDMCKCGIEGIYRLIVIFTA